MLKPIISADSHVSEPPNCYIDNIDPKFRDRAPRLEHDERRGDVFRIEGSKQPIPMSLVSAAGNLPKSSRRKARYSRSCTEEDGSRTRVSKLRSRIRSRPRSFIPR